MLARLLLTLIKEKKDIIELVLKLEIKCAEGFSIMLVCKEWLNETHKSIVRESREKRW